MESPGLCPPSKPSGKGARGCTAPTGWKWRHSSCFNPDSDCRLSAAPRAINTVPSNTKEHLLVWLTPKYQTDIGTWINSINFHFKLHILYLRTKSPLLSRQGREGSTDDPVIRIRSREIFKHSTDIPLRSPVHFGMFALKTTLLGNSNGTKQSNMKSWAVLQSNSWVDQLGKAHPLQPQHCI